MDEFEDFGSSDLVSDSSGGDLFDNSTEDIVEPGASMSHGEFIEEQDKFEEEIMGEREPGAVLSHNEFIEEQDKFEEEIMGEREPGAELSHQEFIDEQDKFEAEIENQAEVKDENTAEIEEETKSDSEYIKIGGDSVNPESPYVTDRQTAEDSGYIEKDGNEVVDSEKVKEELALPDGNPAEYAHEMPHISDDTHDLYKSDVAPNFGHEGGGEQTIAIRQEGESLADGNTETPTYEPEHSPGEEGVIDDRKQLEDFSDKDWESAYAENEMYASVRDHNENYQDNQLDFYEISNSGENFERADGESAYERAKERDFKSI